jgi:1-acyl-sn-glycerol-3-phosphate acyltransferase
LGQKIARFLIHLFVRITSRIDVYGLENLPTEGNFVLASNHLGRLDAFYTYVFLDQEDIILLAAEKYKKYAVARWFARQLNAIWVDRYNADFGAIRDALKRMKAGGILVLAPEGTRSKTGTLQKAHAGGGYLAAKAGVPIVPGAITGTEDGKVYSQLGRLRRPHVILRAGKPFTLPPLPVKNRDAALQEYTDEIMCQIAAMLPESYRGVYADHPRLLELLEEQKGELGNTSKPA